MKPGPMLWTIQTTSEWLIHWTFSLSIFSTFLCIWHVPIRIWLLTMTLQKLHHMFGSTYQCLGFCCFSPNFGKWGWGGGALYPKVPSSTPQIHQEGHDKTHQHADETTHFCIALLCTLLMCWPHALQVINGRCQSMPENSILANRKMNKTPILYQSILYLEKWHKAVTIFKIFIPNQPLYFQFQLFPAAKSFKMLTVT